MKNVKQLKKNKYNKISDNDIYRHLVKAEMDIEHGRVKNAEDVFEEWKDKYGI